MVAARQVTHGPDQPYAAPFLEGKHDQKIGIFEVEVRFIVGRRPRRVHIGDVKQPRIGSPRKANGERSPDRR